MENNGDLENTQSQREEDTHDKLSEQNGDELSFEPPSTENTTENTNLSTSIFQENLKAVGRTFVSAFSVLQQQQALAQSFSEAVRPLLESYTKALRHIGSFSKQLGEFTKDIFQAFAQIATTFQISSYTEEQKQKLIKTSTQWGEYGWNLFLVAPPKFYFKGTPKTITEANEIAKQFCSQDAMRDLFSNFRSERIRSEDLEAAITCFENRLYKPCAIAHHHTLCTGVSVTLVNKCNRCTKRFGKSKWR